MNQPMGFAPDKTGPAADAGRVDTSVTTSATARDVVEVTITVTTVSGKQLDRRFTFEGPPDAMAQHLRALAYDLADEETKS